MLKPICVKCERFMRVQKNGIVFIEGAPTEPDAKAGVLEPEKWKPYKVWSGDLWRCPDCGFELISGVGFEPITERHYSDFLSRLNALEVFLLVKDC